MKPFEKCPVYWHCGEKLYSPETGRKFGRIRDKLERQETGSFHLLGQTFKAA